MIILRASWLRRVRRTDPAGTAPTRMGAPHTTGTQSHATIERPASNAHANEGSRWEDGVFCAASGIGFGIATALAPAGSKVMLCDIRESPLAAALEDLAKTNAEVHGGVTADVSLKSELAAE